MYHYDLSEQAKEDLLRIYEYGIGQFGIDQADKYFDMMHDCFSKIAKNPHLLYYILEYIYFNESQKGIDIIWKI